MKSFLQLHIKGMILAYITLNLGCSVFAHPKLVGHWANDVTTINALTENNQDEDVLRVPNALVLTIDSKVDEINADLLSCCASLSSKIDVLDGGNAACCFTLNSKVDEIDLALDECCATLNSKVDNLQVTENTILSTVDIVQASLNACCFTLNSKVDEIDLAVDECCATLNSKVDNLQVTENTILSRVDALQSDLSECCFTLNSKVDEVSFDACCFTLNSKIDQLGCSDIPLTVPSTGTTISVAGVYCLTDHVTLGTANTILISATDVVLDLNDHTVSGGETTGTFRAAIKIGADRVTVRNGYLSTGGTAYGIGTNSAVQRAHTLIENVQISLYERGLNLSIRESQINNVKVSNASLAINLSLSASQNCALTNCQVLGIAGAGFNLDGTQRILLKNCIAKGNVGTGFQALGIAGNITFDSCIAINQATAGFTVTAPANQSVEFLDCLVEDSFAGFIFTNASGLGSFSFVNCQALRNLGASGFDVQATSGLLESCSAIENGDAGFDMGQSTEIVMRNCEALANAAQGFDMFNVVSGLVEGCTASTNSTHGFDLNGALNCSIFKSIASDNVGNGFDTTLSVTGNVISECQAVNNEFFGFVGAGTLSAVFYANYASGNLLGNFSGIVTAPPPTLSSAPTSHINSTGRLYGDNLATSLP